MIIILIRGKKGLRAGMVLENAIAFNAFLLRAVCFYLISSFIVGSMSAIVFVCQMISSIYGE